MISPTNQIIRKIIIYSIYGFFLSATFSIAMSQICSGLAVIFGTYLIIIERRSIKLKKLNQFTILILLYIGWTIVSSIVSPTPLSSFWYLREHWLFLIIPIFAISLDNQFDIEKALMIFAISAIVLSLYGIWQHFYGIDLWRSKELIHAPESGYYPIGKFRSRTTFSSVFMIISVFYLGLAPYARDRAKTILYYMTSGLCAIAVLLTVARAPMIVLVISFMLFLVFSWRRFNKIVIGMILIAVIGSTIVMSPGIINRFKNWTAEELEGYHPRTRIANWRTSTEIAIDYPVFGVGATNFKKHFIEYQTINKHHYFHQAHNDFLTNAVNFGFPGAVLWLAFWWAIFLEIKAQYRNKIVKDFRRGIVAAVMLSSIAFFISSQLGAAFIDEEPRIILMAIWGLFFAVKQQVKQNDQTSEMIEKA